MHYNSIQSCILLWYYIFFFLHFILLWSILDLQRWIFSPVAQDFWWPHAVSKNAFNQAQFSQNWTRSRLHYLFFYPNKTATETRVEGVCVLTSMCPVSFHYLNKAPRATLASCCGIIRVFPPLHLRNHTPVNSWQGSLMDPPIPPLKAANCGLPASRQPLLSAVYQRHLSQRLIKQEEWGVKVFKGLQKSHWQTGGGGVYRSSANPSWITPFRGVYHSVIAALLFRSAPSLV